MSMMFVASIYLLIGLVLGVTIGWLLSEAREGRQGENSTAIKIAESLDDGEVVSISTVVSKSSGGEEEEEEDIEDTDEWWKGTKENWRYN